MVTRSMYRKLTLIFTILKYYVIEIIILVHNLMIITLEGLGLVDELTSNLRLLRQKMLNYTLKLTNLLPLTVLITLFSEL